MGAPSGSLSSSTASGWVVEAQDTTDYTVEATSSTEAVSIGVTIPANKWVRVTGQTKYENTSLSTGGLFMYVKVNGTDVSPSLTVGNAAASGGESSGSFELLFPPRDKAGFNYPAMWHGRFVREDLLWATNSNTHSNLLTAVIPAAVMTSIGLFLKCHSYLGYPENIGGVGHITNVTVESLDMAP